MNLLQGPNDFRFSNNVNLLILDNCFLKASLVSSWKLFSAPLLWFGNLLFSHSFF